MAPTLPLPTSEVCRLIRESDAYFIQGLHTGISLQHHQFPATSTMHTQTSTGILTYSSMRVLTPLILILMTLSAFGKDAPIDGDGGIKVYGNVYWQELTAAIYGISSDPKGLSAFISDTFKTNSKYKGYKHWVRDIVKDDFDRQVAYVTTRARWDTLTTPGYDYIKWRVVISTNGRGKIEKGWDRTFKPPFKAVPED